MAKKSLAGIKTSHKAIAGAIALVIVGMPTLVIADAPSPEVLRADQRAKHHAHRVAHKRAKHKVVRRTVRSRTAVAQAQPPEIQPPVEPAYQAPPAPPVYQAPPPAPLPPAPPAPPAAPAVTTPVVTKGGGIGAGMIALLAAAFGGGIAALSGGSDSPTSP